MKKKLTVGAFFAIILCSLSVYSSSEIHIELEGKGNSVPKTVTVNGKEYLYFNCDRESSNKCLVAVDINVQ